MTFKKKLQIEKKVEHTQELKKCSKLMNSSRLPVMEEEYSVLELKTNRRKRGDKEWRMREKKK